MTLLHPVVQILVLPVQHLGIHYPVNRFPVGRMFVSRHPQRLLSRTIQQSAQETTRCSRGRLQTREKSLCHIAEAELVSQTPEDSEQDNVGRQLQVVER